MRRLALACTIGCAVACVNAPGVYAQSISTAVAFDSTVVAPHLQQNLWVSAGLGPGGNGVAAVINGWYAYGRYVVGARASQGGPLFGQQTREKAALVGLRVRSPHTFALLGVGAGTMNGWRSNGEQSGTRTLYPDEPSIAFGAEIGVTYYAIGIGLDAFGSSNPHASYGGIALVVQVGYLK